MLRRKLILSLGPPVVMLLITAVAAVWILESLLGQMDHITTGVEHAMEAATPDKSVHAHTHAEIVALARSFRQFVFGLSIVFVLVINISIVLLLHVGGTILEPIHKLVHGARQLAEGRFEHRVKVDQHDEFDELALAFNKMAERLEAQERRKIEVLGQLGLALNHELNNAVSIIELQLKLLARQAPASAQLEQRLRQIHQSLSRMTSTVQNLKNVRRIVLTEYVPGLKMLDLKRSVQEESSENPAPAGVP